MKKVCVKDKGATVRQRLNAGWRQQNTLPDGPAIRKGDVIHAQSFTVILRGFTRSDLGKVRVSTP